VCEQGREATDHFASNGPGLRYLATEDEGTEDWAAATGATRKASSPPPDPKSSGRMDDRRLTIRQSETTHVESCQSSRSVTVTSVHAQSP